MGERPVTERAVLMATQACRTILLVEDEAVIALAEQENLRRSGYEVVHVRTAEQAVSAMDADPAIDLVLMDIDLGKGMDGTEAARVIVQRHDIPVVFLSSHTEKPLVEKTEEITSYGYVLKESGFTVLEASIRMAFKLHEAHTALRRSENALRQRERLLNTTQHLSRTGGWEFDVAAGGMTWTDETYRIHDMDPEELSVGSPEHIRRSVACYRPEDAERILAAFRRCAGSGEPYDFEVPFTTARGRRLWVRTTAEAVRENGRITGVVGNIVDVTARRELDEQLIRERNRAQQYFDIAGVMIVAIDGEGTIIEVNRRGCAILGSAREELIGRNWFDGFVPENQREDVRKVFRRLMAGEIEPVEYYENPIHTAAGEERLIAWHNTLMRDEEGRITGTLSSGEDITERKRDEERIRHLLEEKEIILKEVHHRVKNNMNVIISVLGLQSSSARNPETSAALRDAAGRVRSMMVLYDKLYRSRLVSAMSLRDYLPPLVREIAAVFPPVPAVTVTTDVGDIALRARVLSTVGIIVNELVTNAMKHAFAGRDHGAIVVRAHTDNGMVRLVCEDDGPGTDRGSTGEGSPGFGLQLVAMLARQLDGRLVEDHEHWNRVAVEFPAE